MPYVCSILLILLWGAYGRVVEILDFQPLSSLLRGFESRSGQKTFMWGAESRHMTLKVSVRLIIPHTKKISCSWLIYWRSNDSLYLKLYNKDPPNIISFSKKLKHFTESYLKSLYHVEYLFWLFDLIILAESLFSIIAKLAHRSIICFSVFRIIKSFVGLWLMKPEFYGKFACLIIIANKW